MYDINLAPNLIEYNEDDLDILPLKIEEQEPINNL